MTTYKYILSFLTIQLLPINQGKLPCNVCLLLRFVVDDGIINKSPGFYGVYDISLSGAFYDFTKEFFLAGLFDVMSSKYLMKLFFVL